MDGNLNTPNKASSRETILKIPLAIRLGNIIAQRVIGKRHNDVTGKRLSDKILPPAWLTTDSISFTLKDLPPVWIVFRRILFIKNGTIPNPV